MEEETAVAAPAVAKKRTAAECHDTSTTATDDPTTATITDNASSCHVEEPCGKKPKLSKKELLEAAKARLKEAQEKKKLLQAKLLEEEKAAAEQAQQQEQQDALMYGGGGYDQYDDYYYEYEYHIPPVTGSRESLFITQIESTGPIDKVRFIQDKQSCITSVVKVIAERKRSATISPLNAGTLSITTATASAAKTPTANPPGPPPLPPPQQDNLKSVSIMSETSANNPTGITGTGMTSKPNALLLSEGLKSPRSSSNSRDRDLTNHPTRGHPNGHPGPPIPPPPAQRQPQHASPHHPPPQQQRPPPPIRQQSQGSTSTNNSNNSRLPPTNNRNGRPDNLNAKPSPAPVPPKDAPRRTSSSGSNSQSHQTNTNGRAGPGPGPPPASSNNNNNNNKRPWKLALCQITAKTLDYTGELPTKTGYTIRTSDQGVVAHVQFFSMPPNTTLLEHNPSKRHLHEHFVSLAKLPVSKAASWKGQELLQFLKNQDSSNSGGRKTYQPPARRNLPCTYWALLDLESPLLQTIDSVGYFTAAPAAPAAANAKSSNATTKTEISFAGKLVWNMNDFYSSDRNNNNTNTSSGNCKLSKWGEVVSAVATSGIRNAPLIATIQGFYEIHNHNANSNNNAPLPPMPPKLRARKVILSKSRTIGIIIGCCPRMSASAMEQQQQQQQQNQNNNNNNNGPPNNIIMGCCQVLFPNGMASGPSSAQSLKGARAILYD